MSGLKPIGSEKLTGQDKINRIMEIARFNETIPQIINETAKSEYSISLADGNKYEIVRERQGYIIKKTISESETEYIEPMKNRKYYSSYSQAFKRLNLVAGELNRINENEEGVSLYGEQKKFTLKTPKPAAPEAEAPAVPAAPPAVPSPELPPSPMDGVEDMGMEDMGMEDMGTESPEVDDVDVDIDVDTEEGGEEEQVSFKSIQKLTGKLTQKIRTLESQEGMTSEDIKYDTEVEDIQADMDVAIESEMEEGNYGSGAIFDSIFGESKVDKVISKYFEVTKKEIREGKEKQVQKTLNKKTQVKQLMESVSKMTTTIEQELSAEKFLKENANSNFVGITNKKNLVFETKKGQVKITPNGEII